MYYYIPHTGKFQQNTRTVTRSTYVPRRYYDDDVLSVPFRPASSYLHRYDTTGTDYYTRSQVNRELLLSSAAMEDNFDISNRSRQRDRDVIAAANRAISPTLSTSSGLDTMSGGARKVKRSQSLRRANPRSSSAPPKRPTSVTTTTLIPLDLSSSTQPRSSPYLKYSNSLNTTRSLLDDSYSPLYSQTLRTPRSPSRDISPLRDESPFRDISPYRSDSPFSTPSSGVQTPVEHWYPPDSSRVSRKRRKPRVLSTKRKMGNYYNRLLNRRASETGGQMGKYWPYLDVEDIENTSIGDLLSDTESLGESGSTYLVEGCNARSYGDYDENDNALVVYSPDSDSDIPSEYVPFRPRVRYRSPERDYSELSVIPYLPKRDPTKNTAADDIAFNAVVAASAARARKALEQINFDDYDSAAMVFSVEGEYQPPEGDTPIGFRYVSRPLALKVPARQIVSAYDSDDSFTKYLKDLQSFREGIRRRLEEGYRALSDGTRSYRPSLPSSSYQPYTSRKALDIKPYKSRLRDSSEHTYGQSLELYPLASSEETMKSRSRSRQRYSEDEFPESSRALKLYDSNTEPDSKLSTLSKIQIKAALIGSKVDVTLPKRRPRSVYAQEKMRQIHLHGSRSRDASPVGAQTAAAIAGADTAKLKAHRPVFVPTYSKPIQDVDGPKKPNIMSWQYRIDAYTPPEDLILVPRSLSTVKSKLLECKDKLDRHRQLMDRYLVTDTGMSVDDMQVVAASKAYLGSRA